MPETVSIIIPTRNRPLDLASAVESILRQSIPPVQLVVVDQSETDEAERCVEKLFAQTLSSIRLCYVRDAGISGGAVARNRGMAMAQGDIWLFLDDDVILETAFIRELLTVYRQYPYVSAVSGIISNYPLEPWPYRVWAATFVRGPFHDERQPIYRRADHLRKAEPMEVSKVGGGLMSFRAEAIRGLCFDENLTGVSDGEDVDFCARLGPNATLLIAPRARLAHKGSPIGRSQDHWLRRFAQANYYLYYRDWHGGLRNHFAFYWLNVGLGTVASLSSVRRWSLAPWLALLRGAREGKRVGRVRAVARGKGAGLLVA